MTLSRSKIAEENSKNRIQDLATKKTVVTNNHLPKSWTFIKKILRITLKYIEY